MSKNQEIAQTIYEQLGGNKFRVMTGAKNFLAIDNGLQFHAARQIVQITVNDLDLYDITLGKVHKLTYKETKRAENIYASGLAETFENLTGLRTSLGTMRG